MQTDRETSKGAAAAEPLPQLIGIKRVAELLSMSLSKLEKLAARKQIPHVKIGRSVRYDVAEVRAWLDARTCRPVAP